MDNIEDKISLINQKLKTAKGNDIKQVSKDIKELNKDIKELIEVSKNQDTISELKSINKHIKENKPEKVKIPENISIDNFPEQKEVKIPEYPKEIKVSNLGEIPKPKDIKFPEYPKFPKLPEYPKTIDIKKPKWYQKFDSKGFISKINSSLSELLVGIREILKSHQDPENALAVKLVDKNDEFYKAVSNAVASGGGGNVSIIAPGTVGNGQKSVTTAGTAEQIGSGACKSITIKAKTGNTGDIYVGSSTVDSSNGFVLDAGDTLSMDINDLELIYLDSSINGDGISFIYVN